MDRAALANMVQLGLQISGAHIKDAEICLLLAMVVPSLERLSQEVLQGCCSKPLQPYTPAQVQAQRQNLRLRTQAFSPIHALHSRGLLSCVVVQVATKEGMAQLQGPVSNLQIQQVPATETR